MCCDSKGGKKSDATERLTKLRIRLCLGQSGFLPLRGTSRDGLMLCYPVKFLFTNTPVISNSL